MSLGRWWGRSARSGSPPDDEGRLPDWTVSLVVEARTLADALGPGDVASLFRGGGLEPRSVRPWAAGDDARSVDWRVTARKGELHVRETEAEREMPLLLVVDRSGSMRADGAATRSARVLSAALADRALRSGHPVGLVTFSDEVERFVPPSRARGQLPGIARALSESCRGTGSNLAAALDTSVSSAVGRCLLVVVSDFCVPDQARAERALGEASRRHEVVPIAVRSWAVDPAESIGPLRVVDPETGRRAWVDGVPRRSPVWIEERASMLGVTPLPVDPTRALAPQLAPRFGGRRRRSA